MPTPEHVPPMHPLENPVIWLLIQVAEFTVATLLLRWLLPDSVPIWIGIVLLFLVVAGLTWADYAIRRRFIPR
jgi:protein-S-isoprenylcysteine O-methyltransferase Ste14